MTSLGDYLARLPAERRERIEDGGKELAELVMETRREALEEAAKIADEWHVCYEKPGSGTRHSLRIAHYIRELAGTTVDGAA